MRCLAKLSLTLLLAHLPFSLSADPSDASVMTHPKSKCVVESTAGEYPLYKVKRKGKTLYAPKSDGIIKAIFSPDGSHIAFSGSEISGVDIRPGFFEFSVVVLECETGTLIGFSEGFPLADLRWDTNRSLRFTDAVSEEELEFKF